MEEELQKIGLSRNEARIYVALLHLGESSAPRLAECSKIKRPTVYLALHALLSAGLVHEKYHGKKRLFEPESPDQLKKIVKRLRRKVIESELLLESLIPALSGISPASTEDPRVSFYRGLNGIKNLLIDIAASKTSWYFFGASAELIKQTPLSDIREILDEGEKSRQKSGRPKIFFLTDSGILTLKEFQEQAPERREIKILPKKINTHSALLFNSNRLIVLSFGIKPFAAMIESREVVEGISEMFKLIWGFGNYPVSVSDKT